MKKIVMIFLFTFPLFAKESDPNGWTKAKWGMTEEQVKKAFSGSIPAETTIGNYTYKVTLKYDGSGKLQEVMLGSQDGSPTVAYKDIIGKLKTKYGKPETEENDFAKPLNQSGRTIWMFKNTTVTVRVVHNVFGEVETKFILIKYQKAGIKEAGSENL